MMYDVILHFKGGNYPLSYLLDKPAFEALHDLVESGLRGSLTFEDHLSGSQEMILAENVMTMGWYEIDDWDEEEGY
jgi:hypothetical protein